MRERASSAASGRVGAARVAAGGPGWGGETGGVPESAPESAARKALARAAVRRREAVTDAAGGRVPRAGTAAGQLGDGLGPVQARRVAVETAAELSTVAAALRRLAALRAGGAAGAGCAAVRLGVGMSPAGGGRLGWRSASGRCGTTCAGRQPVTRGEPIGYSRWSPRQ